MTTKPLIDNALLDRIIDGCNIRANGCWLWRGADVNGKPRIWVRGKTMSVRRAVCQAMGISPRGTKGSTCGCSWCVNPSHLRPDA